ncbi:hypothetical protein [Leptolyngbya sp. PCC 6406]|uniref:hypothetical protein n=1 Tax=Leptolyngbya sp. PCC 6406 TaxID=1173264 RepID=UPI0002ABF4C3|nr:hypothetical protein [Leptolyngbya sp. PCC 6406]
MERGLLWLPLLGVFIWLAWAGWNEFHKLEAYKVWAQDFDRAKYDIYAVLGQSGSTLRWGHPTRQGPVKESSLDLTTVTAIRLYGGDPPLPANASLPRGCTICLRLTDSDGAEYDIPFTDLELAEKWRDCLAGGM